MQGAYMVVARPSYLLGVTVESQVWVDRYVEWLQLWRNLQPAAGDLDFLDISSRPELRCSAKNYNLRLVCIEL